MNSVIEELNLLKENYGVKEIFFLDDMFNSDVRWAESILTEIINQGLNRHMRFMLQLRVNEKITPESLFKLASRAGVYGVIFGVESGSQKILDQSNKKIKVSEIERAFDLAGKAGLMTVASFIFGLPGEDGSTIAETERLFRKIRPSVAGLGFATPLTGNTPTGALPKGGASPAKRFS